MDNHWRTGPVLDDEIMNSHRDTEESKMNFLKPQLKRNESNEFWNKNSGFFDYLVVNHSLCFDGQ
jgi:hypothetical protein